jgi:hypothetical protein
MEFDSARFGPEQFTREDACYRGSTFAEVKAALFRNAYYLTWGASDEPPLPVYDVTLGRALAGVLRRGKKWLFQRASDRAVDSHADLRWGPDKRGFRRILHPNGVCLTGRWEIEPADTGYSGYFKGGSRALVIARYSTCCTETRRGRYRSLAMVGKLYPTTDPAHKDRLATANFITQEDFGGTRSIDISQVELRNAPDTTPWRRGLGFPVLLVTAFVLGRSDRMPTIRQLYEIAELGKPKDEESRTPQFMRLTTDPPEKIEKGADVDFRDEVLGRIYDRGDPKPQRQLVFNIEVAEDGVTSGIIATRLSISNWRRIGRIVFDEAVASYNGDFVVHFHHPPWRRDRNDPSTTVRRPPRLAADHNPLPTRTRTP